MIRLLLFALLFYLAFRLARAAIRSLPRSDSVPPEKTRRGEEMVLDSHCGVYLPRGDAVERKIGGKAHFFCSEKCRDAFLARR